ncbi:alanine--tRNA ligase [Jiulongibacter sediminis]|uniref:Alanine--tRNA ligase n=1 Tax=Jiulongibacter sediminis TaxID=1605367 RepID=A0A0P7C6K1_9BACT|nr:alanine--tRNA ligase [Jiulongibacter sediminis]KPM49950.1 alanyl-tRNA synthetase [Jiulongibacter sediminis]TBX27179.1 alanyl-tRNA synthetase [Jiulongibacter sediminis]
MTSHEIRKAFLDFFVSKQHLIVPSAPMVAKNDPTLMFQNSGMAQFKDFFLGNATPPATRIADTQKCLRVSGKHNDLEEVGFDTYHHTMFEMLGNWSFGDYFKTEALHWAYELLTEVYKLPKDRLYVSVFEGDKKDNVPFDQEAFDIWKSILGSDERIIYGNKKDNFWEMGDVGPCGPCSEIHIDLRPEEEIARKPGKDLVNADHPQVVEIWNVVFMQFERRADGSLDVLEDKCIDTGMGFERLCMAIQGKQSNYDTDIFQNTIQVLEEMSGLKYGANGTLSSDNYGDVAMRVVADHIRAVAFAITDGQLPSNNGAGYVIRRILRRAIRYGYSYLNFKEPFMSKLVPVLAKQFKDVFPELKQQEEFVTKVIEEEEKTFLRTLDMGLKRLDQIFENEADKKEIDGKTVFELSDTFGFPVDLTALIAREKGFKVDEAGFKAELAKQKERSRKDATKEAADWFEVNELDNPSYIGYDHQEAVTKLVQYRKVKTKKGEEFHVVLEQTPFYAEMGGQVGDTGVLEFKTPKSEFTLEVVDCQLEAGLHVHIVKKAPFEDISIEDLRAAQVTAKIDKTRHSNIIKNHSATHLMLAALREVLGDHIVQRGSYQNDEVTRFDFSHFSKVTDEELQKVEDIVNTKIRQNIALDERRNVPIDEAMTLGATATFGEKYGDFVRVIIFDPKFSIELCGGNHVPATGEIGLFKFTSEGSVSAGVRRVEAVTGIKALERLREQEAIINELKAVMKSPQDLVASIKALQEEKTALQKKVEALENEKLQNVKLDLLKTVVEKDGAQLISAKVEVANADALKQLTYDLKAKLEKPYVVLGTELNGKPLLAVMIDDSLVSDTLHAGKIVKEAAKEMRGGGGGQPHFATAGGSDVNGLQKAIEKAVSFL